MRYGVSDGPIRDWGFNAVLCYLSRTEYEYVGVLVFGSLLCHV